MLPGRADGEANRIKVERAIHTYAGVHGESPTYAELATLTGLSKGHLRATCAMMVRQGRLSIRPGARGFRLLPLAAPPLRPFHVRTLLALQHLGEGAPVPLSAISVLLIDPRLVTDGHELTRLVLDDLIRRGLVAVRDGGYVVVEGAAL